MRDFLWGYFSLTGEIDAYLLYKEHENFMEQETVDSTGDGLGLSDRLVDMKSDPE